MNHEIASALVNHELGNSVLRALQCFLDRDRHLLNVDANERSLSHCLAIHLQAQFPLHNVDCEYNRDGIDPKRLGHLDLLPDSEDVNARTVFPDIIVHRRGSPDNVLVLEIKKNSNHTTREIDFAKLRGYRRELGYRAALFIEFAVGESAGVSHVQWIDA